MKKLAFWGLLGMIAVQAAGAPGWRPPLHELFSDDMILQRDKPVPVWGWSDPGTEITVEFSGQKVSAKAAAPSGRWQADLAPLKMNTSGAPLTVTLGSKQIVLKNVIVGDVWLAGGQSNMEFGIMSTNQWWNQVGTHPGIRLYLNPPTSFSPLPREQAGGKWEVCNPNSLNTKVNPHGGFSAVAYFFAREVNKATGVPIGMIQSCIGNTDIETWMDPAGKINDRPNTDSRKVFSDRLDADFQKGDPNFETTLPWRNTSFDDSSWKTVSLPRLWRNTPESGSLLFFRRTVEVPESWNNAPIRINLGAISHHDTLWANGVFIGAIGHHQRVRRYEIPAGTAKNGKLQLTLRVNMDAGFTGKPEDMWLLGVNADPSAQISLAGDWKYAVSTKKGKLKVRFLPDCWMPGSGYNGMIAPLAPFALKGFIWYQGCGNTGNSRYYMEDSKTMITSWRKLFNAPDAPFYCVQLAGYGPYKADPVAGSGWATIREIQSRLADEFPHTGFAVAFDRGEQMDIHPPHKKDVGERLARVALAQTYGKDVEFRGPQCKSVTRDGAKLRVVFNYADKLRAIGGAPAGFAVAGADRKFFWANAKIEGDTVVLSSDDVAEPVWASFAWADNTLFNMYNGAGLPMVPFQRQAGK